MQRAAHSAKTVFEVEGVVKLNIRIATLPGVKRLSKENFAFSMKEIQLSFLVSSVWFIGVCVSSLFFMTSPAFKDTYSVFFCLH